MFHCVSVLDLIINLGMISKFNLTKLHYIQHTNCKWNSKNILIGNICGQPNANIDVFFLI